MLNWWIVGFFFGGVLHRAVPSLGTELDKKSGRRSGGFIGQSRLEGVGTAGSCRADTKLEDRP